MLIIRGILLVLEFYKASPYQKVTLLKREVCTKMTIKDLQEPPDWTNIN